MIAPNRFQSQQIHYPIGVSVTIPRTIGTILDAVLAKYGIEFEDDATKNITVEMTDKNTTIINASGRKATARSSQNYPLLTSAVPENLADNRPKNERKWQQRFLF